MNLESFFAPYDPPRSNFVEILRYWTEQQPDAPAFYYTDGEDDDAMLTYAQLWERVRALAGHLQQRGATGGRVLLLYPPGLEFVVGFFACHAAGATAVPAYPPRRNRKATRIHSISKDSGAGFALSIASVIEQIYSNKDQAADLSAIEMIASDDPSNAAIDAWKMPTIAANDIAMLQYTSGSTGDPKGVMLTHGNLIANCEYIVHAFTPTRAGSGASWLPTYHDMGLVGGVLKPLFYGRPNVLMSPMAFLQKPVRWLQMISKYKVSISGGPNFAYQLCVEKVTPEEIATLDLSGWEVAFNGAEPVRPTTIDAFAEKFASAGFRRDAFLPCYGMAETTLIVTGGPKGQPVVSHFSADGLNNLQVKQVTADDDDARALVGCGEVIPGERVEIVDPDSFQLLEPAKIGEVWVQSPSVGKGYWNDDAKTRAVFGASTADGQGPFLRTGDLGFMHEGQLYVTGRLKDMIIVRGVNRYPQDIELTCEQASDVVQSGAVAAMAMDFMGREQLMIVAETVRIRNHDWNAEIDRIRKAVTAEHELPPDAIYMVRAGSVPKTSSGKIQRHACLDMIRANELKIVGSWSRWESHEPLQGSTSHAQPKRPRLASEQVSPEIVSVVIREVKAIARERAGELSEDTNIAIDLGLDSLERLEIAHSLEKIFGGRFPDEALQEMETIAEVALAIREHLDCNPIDILAAASEQADLPLREVKPEDYTFALFPEYKRLKQTEQTLMITGLPNPYFTVHEGLTRDTTRIDGRDLISFASYNYLGMSGDPEVTRASTEAVERFGTSVSASRLVSGNKTIHGELEREIADWVGVEASVVFVGGHSTNETTIGHLVGPGDLILHDALSHNSIIQGALLSGARRRPFEHNDFEALDRALTEVRGQYRRVLVVIEGVYSMDGDFPDLPKFVEIKQRHKCLLMVDEAHSIGTMGATGRGMAEHFGVDPKSVDIWMGTLSKSFGSCGGYIAGCAELVEYLQYTAPGFVYSVGLPPASTAAALASLRVLKAEPQRVARLKERSNQFVREAQAHGLNTGQSCGTPVVPVITGNSLLALKLSHALFEAGINVQPILYPAVEEAAARLRFFITSEHTEQQIHDTVEEVAKQYVAVGGKLLQPAHAPQA
ncbi:Putative fatty-acid--CoA ligase fadD21 [Rosistilla oblonga]|uniref:aminotransferase class I/II-fold pyridoxal phosphate-dependent enzyme n=1 Tax=Rosistilla oblonga TaxID=2527990 RepID=UPI00118D2242|nr:aminotransferase class I/II-fold pyridoxal phosphate-dependent enzyme [Rosistilla oblonga]QDV14161.1 Putative fatty-acid--CoA ligase fadD21 [Rosistilla oblonga]